MRRSDGEEQAMMPNNQNIQHLGGTRPPTTTSDPLCDWCAGGHHDVQHHRPCGCACHEQCLYPARVLTYNVSEGGNGPNADAVEVDYYFYRDAVATKKVGDIVRHELSAPGYGYREYRITRIDERGVWAVFVNDQGGMLTVEMVR